ncbi:MAG: cation-translocating P-type ATPase [Candidatus Tectomicrobia bacterium]|uniref:Cation-translocating P-type ATPase n=1 Tax=Tectimicrobiota bacterium TaxID=2528274 RepID=A0A938B1W2_UNCTE|nr:cation-translocating P-type ATPase [Candidatus Tectomicrobia bacterium]
MRAPWHTMDSREVLTQFQVDPSTGLQDHEVPIRQQQYGRNELVERGTKSPWRIVWEQLTSVVLVVLIIGALVKFLLGEYLDASAILVVVALNTILGFIQEYRAEQAIAALKRMAAPVVRVRRQGQIREIPARDLVPGDLLLLEAGNAIPADARLIEAANLRVQEASLTGESHPVEKMLSSVPEATAPLGDRHNMLYLGTTVTYGRGTAVVTETGMETELGRIAELIQNVAIEATPLQKRVKYLGLTLAIASIAIVALVFALGVWHGREVGPLFLAGVAIAVAAMPEGLPAVLTITLALGAQRMLKRRALIRKLPAVETLGSITTICSDKTGTLTENRMQVQILDVAGHTLDLTEVLRKGLPILSANDVTEHLDDANQLLLLATGVLCNDAVLEPESPTEGGYTTIGDPTEGALLVAAAHFGIWKSALEQRLPRVSEVPFSSERKLMTTVHRLPSQTDGRNGTAQIEHFFEAYQTPLVACTKGAVDSLLTLSAQVCHGDVCTPMTAEMHARITAASEQLAQEGLRVLGLAFRPLAMLPEHGSAETVEQDMTFIGMVGMIDPPRPEVKDAVLTCQTAGIRPVMITGDHPLTARQIARELHIATPDNDRVLTGADLAQMSTQDLEAVVEHVSVYARVSPEHKLHIVQALQQRGHVVAMTGDGVNDAPALRKSDIGVAMGITGTDVAKEAAPMVIMDDNFSTIVNAVEEGRTIYDNVRKFVKYIVTSNFGEVIVMVLTQLFGMPLPMTTLQILWMNLVTDGVPGLALGMEPTEPNAMRRAPFKPGESIFSRGIGRHILMMGPLLALVAFGVGYWAYIQQHPAWGTMVFMTLTLSQLGHALAVRSHRESLFRIGVRSNPLLIGAVGITLALQLVVVYVPQCQALFNTVPLSLTELAICLVLSTVIFWAVELEKWWLRRTGALV